MITRGISNAPRAWRRRPSRPFEPSGSSGVARRRGRAQPRSPRPFGALPKGSSEPRGSPHVRHNDLSRSGRAPRRAERPFGVGRHRRGGVADRIGALKRWWTSPEGSSEPEGGVGRSRRAPWSLESTNDGATNLFGGGERCQRPALDKLRGLRGARRGRPVTLRGHQASSRYTERSAGSRRMCLRRLKVLRDGEVAWVAAMGSWGSDTGSRNDMVVFGAPRRLEASRRSSDRLGVEGSGDESHERSGDAKVTGDTPRGVARS